jgi:DNA-binding SARP family transcriptional activator/tetratricopeptide (TPR) repeat protein
MDPRSETQQTRICLCGEMTVVIGGRSISPSKGQSQKLLAYLVAHRSDTVRREDLFEVLWEGKPPPNYDKGLKEALSRLRREVGREVLPRGEFELRLPDDAWIDLEVIEDQATRTTQAVKDGMWDEGARLADQTLGLMKVFLPRLEARWIDDQRRKQMDLRHDVLEAAVKASLELGGARLPSAKRMAQELVRERPYVEKGHELLMEVHAACGDVAEATRVYHALKGMLDEELGIDRPGKAITDLNARLLRRDENLREAHAPRFPPRRTVTAPEQVPLPPFLESVANEDFVGRDESVARLWARWEKVTARPRAVALTGEPGIGKTRLAACFARRVHEAGHPVLYGRCDENPLCSYQPFVEALDHYAGVRDLLRVLGPEAEELRRLPGLRRRLPDDRGDAAPAGPEDRYALFEAVVAVFRRAGETRPLLLVIDDVHWADDPTFELLLHLLRYLEPRRCMLLITLRDVGGSPPSEESVGPRKSPEDRLDSLHEARVERVGLEGLAEQDTATLVSARRGGAPSAAFVRDLTERTGGNPFFIEETLRSLVERGEWGAAEEPDLDRVGVLQGVEAVITRRLNRLSRRSSEVIAMASVIGPEFRCALLESLFELRPDEVLEALEELVRDGLIVEVPAKPDQFAFAHALLRETQYNRLIGSRRLEMHKSIALELEHRSKRPTVDDDTPTPAELAHHFYEARTRVDREDAAQYSIQAAKYARRSGAYEEAIAHYGRALELLEKAAPDEVRICDLLLAQGKVQLRAGRLEQAEQTFGQAADIARREGAVDRLALAALGFHGMYTAAGEVDERRIALLEEAEAALGDRDSALRVRVLARLADSLLWLTRDRALRLSKQALEMARGLGDPGAVREALGGRHAALLPPADLDERLEVSSERLRLAAEADNREAEAEAVRWYMADLCEKGEIRAAKEHYARLDELAAELRQPQYSSYVVHWRCVFAQLHGRLEQADRLADEGYELAKRAGARDAEMTRLLKRYLIYREQGRGLPELRPAVERFAAEAPTLRAWLALGALMDAQTGDAGQARAQLDRLVVGRDAALPLDAVWLYGVSALAETCALLDDSGEPAAALYSLLLPHSRLYVQVGMITFWGSASRFLGLAATARGDWEAAERDFTEAERRNQRIGSEPLVARTLVDHADMVLRRGEPADGDAASRLLARATRLAEPLGMVEVCRRAAELRERAGARAALA